MATSRHVAASDGIAAIAHRGRTLRLSPMSEENGTDKTEAANADIVPEGSPTRRRLGRVGVILALVSGLLIMAVAGIAFAGYTYSKQFEGLILPGATVAGVDLGGLDADRALDAVEEAVGPQLDRKITIRHRDRTWEVSPRELGARSDAADAVAEALGASEDASFFDKTRMRLLDSELDFDREVAITYPKQGARGFIQGIASDFHRDPRDASVDGSTGWVEFTTEKSGRKVRVRKSRGRLLEALREGKSQVRLAVKEIEPEVTRDDYAQVLLVRIGENKLYLYEDGKIVREWIVATGLPEYPTPTGIFEIELKRYMPTWVNPSPDTWGKDLPATIAPGPGNPLGLRALNWTAPAIRFHGTTNIASLGHQASHGCVRMSNTDVIELYDRVEVGAAIVSVNVGYGSPLYEEPTAVDVETTEAGGGND